MTRNHAAAVNLTTGALLPWNPNVNGTVRALRVVGTTVYMGGAFTQVGGANHTRVAAVQAPGAGAVIPAFKAAGLL